MIIVRLTTEDTVETIVLPDGHAWKTVNPSWLRANQIAWECTECQHVLVGEYDPDGSVELFDVDDVPEHE